MTTKTLIDAGFTEVVRHNAHWYTAKDTDGEEVCFGKQSAHVWHAFYKYRATGSGGTPREALTGGLGDVIGDHYGMKGYVSHVLSAPDHLVTKFDGLYAAQGQVAPTRFR